jgi:hypothetical protein
VGLPQLARAAIRTVAAAQRWRNGHRHPDATQLEEFVHRAMEGPDACKLSGIPDRVEGEQELIEIVEQLFRRRDQPLEWRCDGADEREPPRFVYSHPAQVRLDRKLLAPKMEGLGDGHWTLHLKIWRIRTGGL